MKRGVAVLILGVTMACPGATSAQEAGVDPSLSGPSGMQDSKGESTSPYSIEDLNFLGGDTTEPAFSDRILKDNSAFRRALFSHGLAYRENVITMFSHNVLDNPISADEEVYVGEQPFGKLGTGPLLTWDMRQLHLKRAQLNVGGALNWVTWNPAGPKAISLADMYFYKSFSEDRLELTAGYLRNDFEYVGLKVGGSLTSGAQGVYAVLPFEVGLSHFPIPTPAVNLKWNQRSGTYERLGFQRSVDPGGGTAARNRDSAGFRFAPHGDKLLTIFEAGYQHDAEFGKPETFIRGGTMYNTTQYPNSRTGGSSSGNYCTYLLADHQFFQSDGNDPDHGFYAGASAMVAPAALNVYTQYYELRLYDKAPFLSRPKDMVSLLASRSVYSRDTIRNLLDQGQTVWHDSNSVTASYSVFVARGVYSSMGISYVTGPAVSPHVSNALNFSVQTSFFF